MPKLFIAGHSDSGEEHLPPGAIPWPERTRAWLQETTGQPFELHSRPFYPMGPKAVTYLLGAVETLQPDIAVIPFGAYACTVGLVAESVRVRFGDRAHRLYLRTESAFEARTAEGRLRRAANSGGRRIARALLGTRTLATVDEVCGIYEEVLHRLAIIESLHVVAVLDARFSAAIQEREPLLHSRFDDLNGRLRPVVDQHHFAWVDLEGALRGAPDRGVFHLADGLHTTAAFHEVYFNLMRQALSATAPVA